MAKNRKLSHKVVTFGLTVLSLVGGGNAYSQEIPDPYKIGPNDSRKLIKLKEETYDLERECNKREGRFKDADKRLKNLQTADSVRRADLETSDEYSKNPNNVIYANPEVLQAQRNHANTYADFIEILGQLNEKKVKLRENQLESDISNMIKDIKKLEGNIARWDKLQESIDELKLEIETLVTDNYNDKVEASDQYTKSAKKSKDENLLVSNSNWDKYVRSQELTREVDEYSRQQKNLGSSREAMEEELAEKNQELSKMQEELNYIKKNNKLYVENEELPNEIGQTQTDSIKSVSSLNWNEYDYTKIVAYFNDNASNINVKKLDNSVVETNYIIKEGNNTINILTYEYPNGKSAVFVDGGDSEDEKKKVIVFDKKGKRSIYSLNKNNTFIDSECNTSNASDIILNISERGRETR